MKIEVKCPDCGISRIIDKTAIYHSYFTGRCIKCGNKRDQTGDNNPSWKGGRIITTNGYIMLRCPSHPRAKNNSGYVFEHILVMEKLLGRYLLSGEIVHHKNKIKADNKPENLELKKAGEHTALHWTGRRHKEESIVKMSQAKQGKKSSDAVKSRLKELMKLRLRDKLTGRLLPCQ